ncbi:hypothetical protein L21SP2_0123 [Salinispira pacifica]|uniref:Uncharacterized protein n=1 Tax=Salinispira pacifica TaxID=1307761 RepID=V5WCR7_9SPIO|nr:hypothetical protein L21SP2_0123 [Salinispira pacifica]
MMGLPVVAMLIAYSRETKKPHPGGPGAWLFTSVSNQFIREE